MSLLREIQSDAIDKNVDISVVLRKCNVLAARLGNKNFKLWVERELNGYKSREDLPNYRVLNVESHGNFLGIAWKATDIPIALSAIPEKYRDIVKTVHFMDPISYYQSLITDNKNSGNNLSHPWPADLIRIVGSNIYQNMNCTNAWGVIPYGSLVALVDVVRNKILNFVLEIEAEAPDAGEAPPNTKPIADKRVNQVFNTYIQGNVDSLVAGSQTIIHDTKITIIQNDLESLDKYLKSIGIEQQDLEELHDAISGDAQSGAKVGIGHNVGVWIGKMISKAASGTWKVATTVAATVLAKALASYYGLE